MATHDVVLTSDKLVHIPTILHSTRAHRVGCIFLAVVVAVVIHFAGKATTTVLQASGCCTIMDDVVVVVVVNDDKMHQRHIVPQKSVGERDVPILASRIHWML